MRAISAKMRRAVRDKFGGRCAYSGTVLDAAWQVDHLVPVRHFENGAPGDPNAFENLMPVQGIINHYKGALPIEDFKSWFLAGLHKRLAKLPKNPRVERSRRKKQYLLNVAEHFGITPEKPFSGQLYFETLAAQGEGSNEQRPA